MEMITQMTDVINKAKVIDDLKDMAAEMENAVKRLGETAIEIEEASFSG